MIKHFRKEIDILFLTIKYWFWIGEDWKIANKIAKKIVRGFKR